MIVVPLDHYSVTHSELQQRLASAVRSSFDGRLPNSPDLNRVEGVIEIEPSVAQRAFVHLVHSTTQSVTSFRFCFSALFFCMSRVAFRKLSIFVGDLATAVEGQLP